MIEVTELLEALITSTEGEVLFWRRTPDPNKYIAAKNAIVVSISPDGDDEEGHRIEVINEEGVLVDSIGYDITTGAEDALLRRLYYLARRNAHDADSVLSRLSDALQRPE